MGTVLISSLATFAQIRVGVTGGVQLASQSFDFGGLSLKGSHIVGYQAGLLLDAPLTESRD